MRCVRPAASSMCSPALEIVLPGTYLPARVIGSHEGRTVEPLQASAVVPGSAQGCLSTRRAPPTVCVQQQLTTGDLIDVRLPADQPSGKWQTAVYIWKPRGPQEVLLAGNYAFTELPKGTEFRQSCDYDAAQDKFTQSVLEPDNLLRKLLHRPDGVLRFRFNCVKAVPASGDAASCAAAGADALWSAVVGKQEYGQYRWQPVAAYVADMVHLHFWPSSKLLNFTDEVRAEVVAVFEQLHPGEVPTPQAIDALIAQPTPRTGQALPSSAGHVGPIKGRQGQPAQQQQQHQQSARYQPYSSSPVKPCHKHPAAFHPSPVGSRYAASPCPPPPPAAAPTAHAPTQPSSAPSASCKSPEAAPAATAPNMHSLAAQLASSGLTQTSIASTLSVTAPPQQPVQAVAAAAHQSNPEQLYQTLCCGEHVKLCCYSMSAGQQWAGDGRQLQLVVRELLGTGGNADVYKVEVVKHAAAAAGTATAAARQQQAEAGADSAAANAAAWWAELDACKAAAAAAAAAAAGAAPMFSTSCSYMPSQLFALKVPKPYQCMSPAVQQRWDPTGYFLNSYRVLQQEQQLLSRTADCGWVLQSHAYGVVSYGPCGIQELPCLLLELADGSVQQRLEECQAAAAAEAAAATGPPCRPVGLPDWELWKIIKQVLAGVDDLAAVNIVWKDVKPSNIVFTRRGTRKSILLCDFGSSVLVGADGLEAAPMPAGTAAFKAPELKYGRRVGPACDVWGLGCLLLALRLGREVNLLPDEEASDAAESWDAAAVLREFEGELSRLELAFVARCLAYDPSRRPSAWDLQEDANSETVPASLPRPRGAGVFNSALVGQILAAATVSAAAAANP